MAKTKKDARDRRKVMHLRANLYIQHRGKVHVIKTLDRDLPVCFTPGGNVTPLRSEVTCKRCLRLLALHVATEYENYRDCDGDLY